MQVCGRDKSRRFVGLSLILLGMTVDLPQLYAWMNLELRTPARWEPLRHSVREQRGALVLFDRRRQRLQVTWSTLAKPPLLDQMFDDYRNQQLEADADARIEPLEVPAGWRCVQHVWPDADGGGGVGGAVMRAAHYDPMTHRLLEMVLTFPGGAVGREVASREGDRDAVVRAVLAGARVTGSADAASRWRAFGIDATVPRGLALVGAEVRPGDIALRFRPRGGAGLTADGAREVWVRRMGMARSWFKGDLAWVMQRAAPNAELETQAARVGQHDAVAAEGWAPGPRAKRLAGRLVGRGLRRRELWWHDEEANAVFGIVCEATAASPLRPQGVRVERVLPCPSGSPRSPQAR